MKSLSVVLTLTFLILQIYGIINWPWYGIVSPILIYIGVDIGIDILFIIIAFIIAMIVEILTTIFGE